MLVGMFLVVGEGQLRNQRKLLGQAKEWVPVEQKLIEEYWIERASLRWI